MRNGIFVQLFLGVFQRIWNLQYSECGNSSVGIPRNFYNNVGRTILVGKLYWTGLLGSWREMPSKPKRGNRGSGFRSHEIAK